MLASDTVAFVFRLAGAGGRTSGWTPDSLGALTAGVEFYRIEPPRLRARNRVR